MGKHKLPYLVTYLLTYWWNCRWLSFVWCWFQITEAV